ncbi:UvrD-helicase domain-containing protein [Mucilaginibacter sp.]|uniref:UvrD-helicase domain-containing protein n=1 Tax=Mucilaginibacter sp. TaxID=1882438 RepID=UPI0025FE8D27|nr:UvrD-helicase domain-containing protein [Mucilaginibacter sp.]
MEKPKLIIAGPGGGKTHDLVDEIIRCIALLEPHRTLAAITYTNAATVSIKERLEKKIKLPPNVFIGTTYSFFNAYILLPFASLFGLVELDKLFVEYDIDGRAEEITKKKSFPSVAERKQYKNGVAANLIKKLLDKGIVPFEQIATISSKLIKDKNLRALIGERLQFLFVDEFQDATSNQYAIFDQIRKAKKTIIYAVGDPEQYISNYTIKRAKPHFTKLPIMAFKAASQVVLQKFNKRSSVAVTMFINNFNTQIQQESKYSGINSTGIYFIDCTDISSIIDKYRELTKEVESISGFKRFYLAYRNDEYNEVSEKYNLKLVSNDNLKPHSKLSETLKLICDAVHLPPKKFCEEYKLSTIEFRTLGIKLLRASINCEEELVNFLKTELKLRISGDTNTDTLFSNLATVKNESVESITTELISSIHKSKGLEAEAVLVIAKTNKELKKWLETDRDIRFSDKTDNYRLGFVAFSRAREILCISCLQKLDSTNRTKLSSLKVIFEPSSNSENQSLLTLF